MDCIYHMKPLKQAGVGGDANGGDGSHWHASATKRQKFDASWLTQHLALPYRMSQQKHLIWKWEECKEGMRTGQWMSL